MAAMQAKPCRFRKPYPRTNCKNKPRSLHVQPPTRSNRLRFDCSVQDENTLTANFELFMIFYLVIYSENTLTALPISSLFAVLSADLEPAKAL